MSSLLPECSCFHSSQDWFLLIFKFQLQHQLSRCSSWTQSPVFLPLLHPPPVLFLNATFLSPMLYQVCSWMLKIFRSDQFHEVKDHMCLGCGDNSFSQHKWDTSDWRWERSTDVRSPLHLLRVIAKASLPITVSIPHWDENNLIIPKKRRDPAPYFSKQKQGNKWAWL